LGLRCYSDPELGEFKNIPDEEKCEDIVLDIELVSEQKSTLKISPNPSSGLINIQFDNPNPSIQQIRIFDFQGKLIHTRKINLRDQNVQLFIKTKGLYTLVFEEENHIMTKRVIIN